MTKETDQDRIERISAKILALQAERDEWDEAIKSLRATLGELVENGETLSGEYKIVKYTTTRFDDGLAKKVLTKEEYDSISVPKADSKRAAAMLDEDRVALCKKSFGSTVKLTLRD
jgi:chromosome segregation ATPase